MIVRIPILLSRLERSISRALGVVPGNIISSGENSHGYVGSIELDSRNMKQSQYVALCELLSVLGILLS